MRIAGSCAAGHCPWYGQPLGWRGAGRLQPGSGRQRLHRAALEAASAAGAAGARIPGIHTANMSSGWAQPCNRAPSKRPPPREGIEPPPARPASRVSSCSSRYRFVNSPVSSRSSLALTTVWPRGFFSRGTMVQSVTGSMAGSRVQASAVAASMAARAGGRGAAQEEVGAQSAGGGKQDPDQTGGCLNGCTLACWGPRHFAKARESRVCAHKRHCVAARMVRLQRMLAKAEARLLHTAAARPTRPHLRCAGGLPRCMPGALGPAVQTPAPAGRVDSRGVSVAPTSART